MKENKRISIFSLCLTSLSPDVPAGHSKQECVCVCVCTCDCCANERERFQQVPPQREVGPSPLLMTRTNKHGNTHTHSYTLIHTHTHRMCRYQSERLQRHKQRTAGVLEAAASAQVTRSWSGLNRSKMDPLILYIQAGPTENAS